MTTDSVKLYVAEQFSPYPAGRDDDDGSHNGTKIRKEFLLPKFNEALKKGQKLMSILMES